MLLQPKSGYDFEMVYFNSDGGLSSMCGNGGRCIAAWAFTLDLGDAISADATASNAGMEESWANLSAEKLLKFWAPDGEHQAWELTSHQIALSMNPVNQVTNLGEEKWELNTGSPHFIQFEKGDLGEIDLVDWARSIRYSERYMPAGINVNAVKIINHGAIAMRTYERGVENETLSCGTGVTAAAIAYVNGLGLDPTTYAKHQVSVETAGGQLHVRFAAQNGRFDEILLIGPATFVFEGSL
jgi:diaminopimelate epimerase